jgi:PDZ domain-containing protein
LDTQGTVPAGAVETDPSLDASVRRRRRHPWLTRLGVGLAVFVVVAVVAGFAIRVPYTTIAPGEALSLPSRVKVDGAKSYPDERGDIRLLFVREANHVNLWRYLQARLDSDIDLVKDAAVNPGSLTPSQLNEEGLQQMADAKTAATAVALGAAGYKVTVAPGLTVSDLTPGMPAINVLHWGDVIVSVDGKPVTAANDVTVAISKHKAGDELPLVVERDGKRLSLRVKIGVFTDAALKGRKGIGVELSPRFTFPVKVSVDTTNIGGPSAGLAMTLAILDDLTPGNLTGGARVAVTGTIDPDGNVGEIGGIEQKAVAARAAGVTLFIVPQCAPTDPAPYLASCKADLTKAAKRAGSKISVKPVSTFAQALQVLRAAGGAAVPTTTPTTSAPTSSTTGAP